ncbi:hypothetical protein DXG03_007252 [Asterophora parasitica]|uniref:Uncharacterized protein n=1 Tax=Asterophora parasitica TaxID=117018 RepID=A0A9P7K1V6_9AGAR|nr:hypothetical protein DXG03_007252 [Asterophora parasitica]
MEIDPPQFSDEIPSSSTASSTLVVSSRSPKPTLNEHAIDYYSFHPEFVAALEQMELVPEEDAQPDTQDVCLPAVALLELRAQG